MKYKFEKLDVWNLSLDLSDKIYAISNQLPDIEKFNLTTQINRAITSISLNIAEGSTSQSDSEQSRFLGYAIRSLIEVVACLRLIERRNYKINEVMKLEAEMTCSALFNKLQSFRRALS
jgi:four helix bundle protein